MHRDEPLAHVQRMFLPSLLLSPVDASPTVVRTEVRAQPREDVRSAPRSSSARTSYARPVALAYLIPMSATAASVGLFFLTRETGPTAGIFIYSAALGLVGGVIAPPVVHLVHHNVPSAFASFGGSLLATSLGAYLGLMTITLPLAERDEDNEVAYAIVGFAAGALAFQGFWGLIDANTLAYERREAKDAKHTAPRLVATPFVMPQRDAAVFGLRGAF